MPTSSFLICDQCKENIENEGKHKETCQKQDIFCPNNCGISLPRSVMGSHVAYECKGQKENCKICSEMLYSSNLKAHQEKCEKEQVECKHCSEKMHVSNIMVHETKCLTLCLYCGNTVSRKEFELHTHNCGYVLDVCNSCGARLTKNFMDIHLKEDCLKRMICCENCNCDFEAKEYLSHSETCEVVIISCENNCGKEIPKQHLKHHLIEECPKRILKCEYCCIEIQAESKEDHDSLCAKYPIACPLSCGITVPRENMEEHFTVKCVKVYRQCSFSNMQCKYKGAPAGLMNHMNEGANFHMELMKNEIANQRELNHQLTEQLKLMTSRIDQLEHEKAEVDKKMNDLHHNSVTRYLWKITEFSAKQSTVSNGTSIYSPEFYTHPQGYKLRVALYLKGCKDEADFLSIYLQILSGEYDDELEWPFLKRVTFRLVRQREAGNEESKGFDGFFGPAFEKPKKGGNNLSWGFSRFIGLERLRNGDFVCNDILLVEVKVE